MGYNSIRIGGLQKLTLLDYPGKLACIVFFPGCNLSCPYCHNRGLLGKNVESVISEEGFFEFLKNKKGLLDGVVLTGGEPLLQPNLFSFMLKVKDMGFKVKLDTNGFLPDQLNTALQLGVLDYVAIDIKDKMEEEYYSRTAGVRSANLSKLWTSIHHVFNSGVDYEFRTTVIRPWHAVDTISSITKDIHFARHYYLQKYVHRESVECSYIYTPSDDFMIRCLDAAKVHIPNTEVRG